MQNTSLGNIPRQEFINSGHNACPGCAASLSVRYLSKIMGPSSLFVITASCWSIIAGPNPYRALETTVVHSPFACSAATGSGLKKGLEMLGDYKTQVVVLAGDGGTFDIGLQALSAAAERNEDILYVCYDNEAYMNTGMQKSSATPPMSRTTTTPAPRLKANPKKDIMRIMEAHCVPYAATATVAFPQDLLMKVEKAKNTRGFRFLHLLSPCPPGWGSESDQTISLSRMSVESRLFPLYEVENGEKFTLNYRPAKNTSVIEYLKLQRRFGTLKEKDMEAVQARVDKNWNRLLNRINGL